ncbi:Mad3 protein [Maudiozyma humilis]|uniref:Mad3 protein n=1 Tax=Maudiozyma humilis TaxID=51915 RepID=A0AAV5RS98_MAUHU|nr:Mad3 protein [Kazachstania humilis]
MAMFLDAVPFDEIDEQKENIVPQRRGRSARALRQVLSSSRTEIQRVSDRYEERLRQVTGRSNGLGRLQVYTEYIEWLKNVHHQGAHADLLRVMEQFIEECNLRSDDTWRDHQQCLNIWLYYIDTFFPGSSMSQMQERRDIYIYMFRNKVARRRAEYYVEFSKLLFEMKRYRECGDFLAVGRTLGAEPRETLDEKIAELAEVLAENGVDVGRRADLNSGSDIERLLEKYGNIRVLDKDLRDVLRSNKPVVASVTDHGSKLEIHADGDTPANTRKHDVFCDDESSAWQSKAERLQENRLRVTPLVPETNIASLKQGTVPDDEEPRSKKLTIFHDDIGRTEPVYTVLHQDAGLHEKLDLNLKLLCRPSGEFSPEHILAVMSGYYYPKSRALEEPCEMPPSKKQKTLQSPRPNC